MYVADRDHRTSHPHHDGDRHGRLPDLLSGEDRSMASPCSGRLDVYVANGGSDTVTPILSATGSWPDEFYVGDRPVPSPSPRTVRRSSWPTRVRHGHPSRRPPTLPVPDPSAIHPGPRRLPGRLDGLGAETTAPDPSRPPRRHRRVLAPRRSDRPGVLAVSRTVRPSTWRSAGYLDAIATASRTARRPSGFRRRRETTASVPGQLHVFVRQHGRFHPRSDVHRSPGAPISSGGSPDAIAIAPDQGPTASLWSSTGGSTTVRRIGVGAGHLADRLLLLELR